MRAATRITIVAIALALSGCGSDPAASEAHSGKRLDGSAPAAFSICKACHSAEPGKTIIGPSLHGVFGRKAGTLAGASYSPAMTGSGLVWDEATLDAFLASPMVNVPGTRMSYAGQTDPAKRAAIIAYLRTLK